MNTTIYLIRHSEPFKVHRGSVRTNENFLLENEKSPLSINGEKMAERFANIDVLFFDDLGTEIFSKNSGDTWLQSLLFDIINKRYNNKKATIFSSNHSLNALINECGIAGKTVDRISEMTSGAVMKIEGSSLRSIKKNCIF